MNDQNTGLKEVMGLKEIIYNRRCIRKFLGKPVTDDLLYQVIDAARVSPSPTNSQPWYFYLFSGDDTKQIIEILQEEAASLQIPSYKTILLESAKVAAEAPHIITVWNMKYFSNRLKKIEGFIGVDYYKNYQRAELLSIGCAVENMWLRAHDLGLGMVWINAGLKSGQNCRSLFGINGDIIAYLPIGYPLEKSASIKKKRKALADICSFYSPKEEPVKVP